ncbi:MAG: hypothetical protein HY765_02650 [Rhodomicrobium sp.]|nr:hypothetical protein [Rhodomicrobium sp.]
MTLSSTTAQRPRNALISPVVPPDPASAPAPGFPAALLASMIGHAALLSDTPEKWASTIAMLRQNGVDPQGYDDFKKGRMTAIEHSGIPLSQDGTE